MIQLYTGSDKEDRQFRQFLKFNEKILAKLSFKITIEYPANNDIKEQI